MFSTFCCFEIWFICFKDYESQKEKRIKLELKLQYIYKKRQHKTIKNITTEITNHAAKHHSKELTEKMLRYWERECKST